MDTWTRRELARFDTRQGPFVKLALSRDGRLLATAGRDTTIVIWRVNVPPLKPQTWEEAPTWLALADPDAKKAFDAIVRMISTPDRAVRLLKEQLHPPAADDPLGKEKVADLTRAELRGLRAVEVLEKVGTPQAKALLRELGRRPLGAAVHRAGREALERLGG